MTLVDLTIPGEPVAKGRGRATRTGRVFAPAKTRKAEQTLAGRAMALLADRTDLPLQGPLRVEAVFTRTRPKSWSRRKAEETPHPTSKPDVDNLLKLAKDALNGVVWVDDAQVVVVTARKAWGEAPSTHIIVTTEVTA
jgi:Holliday junction resolvase RusA-like endonuclease